MRNGLAKLKQNPGGGSSWYSGVGNGKVYTVYRLRAGLLSAVLWKGSESSRVSKSLFWNNKFFGRYFMMT